MVAPAGAPATLAGGAGLKGALYTGRGPVCGTIIRGSGTDGGIGALGATGLATMVGGCAGGAIGRGGIATGALVLAGAGGAAMAGRGAIGVGGATGAAD